MPGLGWQCRSKHTPTIAGSLGECNKKVGGTCRWPGCGVAVGLGAVLQAPWAGNLGGVSRGGAVKTWFLKASGEAHGTITLSSEQRQVKFSLKEIAKFKWKVVYRGAPLSL